MTSSIQLRTAAFVLALSFVGCDCDEGNHALEPSSNTVDPAKHDPYQARQPGTTGNPMSDTDAVPDRTATPEGQQPKEEP